jgi:hypothetical protein
MGRSCCIHKRDEKFAQNICWKALGRDRSEDLDIDGKILQCI